MALRGEERKEAVAVVVVLQKTSAASNRFELDLVELRDDPAGERERAVGEPISLAVAR